MNPGWLTAFVLVCVQAVLFFRWLRRRMLDDAIVRSFVRDMAENHLDHIYGALRDIAAAQNIKLKDPPPVRWMRLSDEPLGWRGTLDAD